MKEIRIYISLILNFVLYIQVGSPGAPCLQFTPAIYVVRKILIIFFLHFLKTKLLVTIREHHSFNFCWRGETSRIVLTFCHKDNVASIYSFIQWISLGNEAFKQAASWSLATGIILSQSDCTVNHRNEWERVKIHCGHYRELNSTRCL